MAIESERAAWIDYYDSDYPTSFDTAVGTPRMGYDVQRYIVRCAKYGNSIIDLCCGTGRVTIPLAEAGFSVTGVDVSTAMLDRLTTRLSTVNPDAASRVEHIHQDISVLSLRKKNYDVAICAFNSFLCLASLRLQCDAILAVARHLRPGGGLILDVFNPYVLDVLGERNFAYIRSVNIATQRPYSRFARLGPYDGDQVQILHGWYDEEDLEGRVIRRPFEVPWRVVYRFELELMLERAGFKVAHVWGGHNEEPFYPSSSCMFVESILQAP